jgi:aprataxin
MIRVFLICLTSLGNDQVSKLEKSEYDPLLKTDLSCWRCGQHYKNIPALKEHLQEEWDKESAREKAKIKKHLREVQDNNETTSKVPKLDASAEAKEESSPS